MWLVGGFGSPNDLKDMLMLQATDGWRLVATESKLRAWNWMFPHPMIVFFFERPT